MSQASHSRVERLEELVRSLPKAEIHIHLEDVFDVDAVERLASDAGQELPRTRDSLFNFGTISELFDFYDWACGLVQTTEHLRRLAYDFAVRQASSGVVYADLLVSPIHWQHWRNRIDAMIDTIDNGLREAEQEGFPSTGLCISLSRKNSAAEAEEIVQTVLRRRHPRVVALSIDGNEAELGRTGQRFQHAFQLARAGGLYITAHAGETSGPEGVRDAIEFLAPDRIDHGVRAIEDQSLVSELASRQLPLTICPGSNITLGMYDDRASHPLEALRGAGVRVSVNSDSYVMGCALEREYAESALAYGWTEEIIREIARTSIEASFCEEETKRRLIESVDGWTAKSDWPD